MPADSIIRRFLRPLRRRNQQPHEANEVIRVGGAGWHFARKKYSDIYLWTVLNRIFAGMKSVDFYCTEEDQRVEALCDFLEANAVALLWQWWSLGFIVIDLTRGDYSVVNADRITFDANGHVHQPDGATWVVVYSDEYRATRLSAFKIIRNELDEIDALRCADEYLTKSLGAIGIISGKEMPMAEVDKEEFLDEVKHKVGITPDKYQFLISTGAISYTPIQVPINDLKLSDKIDRALKLICDYFNVPFDLVSFSGASTFANMDAAVRLFYSNCIGSLAEVLLEAGRYAIKRDTRLFVKADTLTFRIDNTAIAVDERTGRTEWLKLAAETVTALAAAGIDPTPLADQITSEMEG